MPTDGSTERIDGTVIVPASKSYAQRALVAGLLAVGETRLSGFSHCQDTDALLAAIQMLGGQISWGEARREGLDKTKEGNFETVTLISNGITNRNLCRIPNKILDFSSNANSTNRSNCTSSTNPNNASNISLNSLQSARLIHLGESGLGTRLLLPVAALLGHPVLLSGSGTLLNRSLETACRPLLQHGVQIFGHFSAKEDLLTTIDDPTISISPSERTSLSSRKTAERGPAPLAKSPLSKGTHTARATAPRDDFRLPLEICGPLQPGEWCVDGSQSSQFVSGLLMTLPLLKGPSILRVENPASIPYLKMTLKVLADFGIRIDHADYQLFHIPGGQHYTPRPYLIEGDWSGAATWLVAGTIAGRVTVCNLNPHSLQADRTILKLLHHVGARISWASSCCTVTRDQLSAFTFDCTNAPDLFPMLAVLAANCSGTSTFWGTERLCFKESNRLSVMIELLNQWGIQTTQPSPDSLTITGGQIQGGPCNPHHDHRIAMACAIASLTAANPITINHPECVDKSYPHFWADFAKLCSSTRP